MNIKDEFLYDEEYFDGDGEYGILDDFSSFDSEIEENDEFENDLNSVSDNDDEDDFSDIDEIHNPDMYKIADPKKLINLYKKELSSIDKYYSSLGDEPDTDIKARFRAIMEDYHSGDSYRVERSKEEAIRSLEGFIFTIIKRKYSTYAPKHFSDLIQEGRAGVLEGMKKYDPELGMPTTFFNPYIKHELQSYITKIVDKTTTHYSTNIKKVNKAIDFFEEKGIPYTLVDIAIQTKMTPEAVKQAMSVRNYRDEIHFESCPRETVPDLKIIQKVTTPEEELIENERLNIVHECIAKCLTEEETQVISLYFGINNAKSYTEGKIAKKLNIPKDKVKRLLNSAQRKLADSDLKFYYKDYLAKDRELIENSEMTFVPIEMARSVINDLVANSMDIPEIPI